VELRETIEALKSRNEEAQAVIHGALNNPDNMKGLDIYQLMLFTSVSLHIYQCFDVDFSCFPDMQIRRQNSCESISSLNSLTSMSSVGSLKDQDAKKKKKKSWVRMNALCARCSVYSHGLVFVCVQSVLLHDNDKAAWNIKYDQSFPPLCCVILLF